MSCAAIRTRCASLGSRCRRQPTAGRPRFGGRPAVPSSCRASTELQCARQEQPAIPHQSMSSLLASVSFVLPADESTMTHVAGRRTCCRAQRVRTVGAAAENETQQRPPYPHFQPIKRLVDRAVVWGDRLDLSRVRHESRPYTSADSAFLGSCGRLRAEDSVAQRVSSGRTPPLAGSPACFPNACLTRRRHCSTKSRRSTSMDRIDFLGFVLLPRDNS